MIIFALLFSSMLNAQNLVVWSKDSVKWGYADLDQWNLTGETWIEVVPCQFDYAEEFIDHIAIVGKKDNDTQKMKYGYIKAYFLDGTKDIKWEFLTDISFDRTDRFINDWATVQKEGKTLFVNKIGMIVDQIPLSTILNINKKTEDKPAMLNIYMPKPECLETYKLRDDIRIVTIKFNYKSYKLPIAAKNACKPERPSLIR